MEKKNTRMYVLAGFLVLLILIYLYSRMPSAGSIGVVAADQKFEPLDVQEPNLRLDLIEKIHKMKYEGTHRNIFSAAAPPIPVDQQHAAGLARPVSGPRLPPPPPPVQFPGQFFGTATMPDSGEKLAFFQQGDDVVVVQEGGAIFGNFRLTHIGNDSVTVEEISSGRSTTVPIQAPVDQAAAADPGSGVQ
jgi:hypothetical protein